MSTTELHIKNRKKLLAGLPENAVVLMQSNVAYPKNGGQYHPFRQDSNFLYLTGIPYPNVCLFLSNNSTQKEILFVRKADQKQIVWEGKGLTFDRAKTLSGIENIRNINLFEETISQLIKDKAIIYMDYYPEKEIFLPYKNNFYEQIKKTFPLANFENINSVLTTLRLIKEKEETDLIRKAVDITCQSFLKIIREVKEGKKEFEIEALFDLHFKTRGASDHAFYPIVATGKNACTLHYTDNNSILKTGELLLLDFGAEFNYYASDCSRTIPVSGKFNTRQKELYEAVLLVFNKAKDFIKPGLTIEEINLQAETWFREIHIKLGLYTSEELERDPNLVKKYFPHGLSHFMGLDVHDVGEKSIKLEEGMVITCEPGIYIPEEETGIRLENDLLITKNGNEDLMTDIPLKIMEIEALMKDNNL